MFSVFYRLQIRKHGRGAASTGQVGFCRRPLQLDACCDMLLHASPPTPCNGLPLRPRCDVLVAPLHPPLPFEGGRIVPLVVLLVVGAARPRPCLHVMQGVNIPIYDHWRQHEKTKKSGGNSK